MLITDPGPSTKKGAGSLLALADVLCQLVGYRPKGPGSITGDPEAPW